MSVDLGVTWSDRQDLDITDIPSLVIRVTTDNEIFRDGFESGDLSAWSVPGTG